MGGRRGVITDVTVCVGTFGEPSWAALARGRVIPSAERQGVKVIHRHGDTLAQARNAAIADARTPFVCVADADDELEDGFFAAMAASDADLCAPAVRYIPGGLSPARSARVPRVVGHEHDCTAGCLAEGNWLVIGTVAPRQLILDVGGFHEHPVFEDWCLWVRCWQAGATVEAVPGAVYRAHVRPRSRNRSGSQASRLAAHQEIARELGLPVPGVRP